MRSFLVIIGLAVLFTAPAGCGGDSGSDDGVVVPSAECEDGAMASDDAYLPFSVGNIWRYRVTDNAGGTPETKRQELEEEMTPPGESEPVIVQRTVKPEGVTVSWLRKVGDTIIRTRQEDYTPDGVLEQVTTYSPARMRFDSTAEHIASGATFTDVYTRVVTDPAGLELSNIEITDAWTVLDVDAQCTTGWGETLSCLHVRRERIVGGIANKEFFFARGYGKVLELGGQTEELIGCTLQ